MPSKSSSLFIVGFRLASIAFRRFVLRLGALVFLYFLAKNCFSFDTISLSTWLDESNVVMVVKPSSRALKLAYRFHILQNAKSPPTISVTDVYQFPFPLPSVSSSSCLAVPMFRFAINGTYMFFVADSVDYQRKITRRQRLSAKKNRSRASKWRNLRSRSKLCKKCVSVEKKSKWQTPDSRSISSLSNAHCLRRVLSRMCCSRLSMRFSRVFFPASDRPT